MARPTRIDQAALLAVARELFLTHGYDVSTAQIAKAAGCSEGTLFKRFKTKEALFHEAMGIPELDFEGLLGGVVGQGDFQESLTSVCLEIVDYLRLLVPRVMRLWAHETTQPSRFMQRKRGPRAALAAFARYFEAEMELGRIAPVEPEVLARVFMGSLHNYVFLELIGVSTRMSARTYVTELVAMIHDGIAPTLGASKARSAP
ncbi:MAG: TetR/AcrR family transcriptional regulator [Deltaproteobacteria bacterium]